MGRPKKVKPDYAMDLLKRYKSARGITSEYLGEVFGIAPSSVRRKWSKGSNAFSMDEFVTTCKILSIPAEDVANAIKLEMSSK